MMSYLNGKKDKTLNLEFNNNKILSGFRNIDSFITNNIEMKMLSNNLWEEHKYMNKLHSISSPRKEILCFYYINCLLWIMDSIENFKNINIFLYGEPDKLSNSLLKIIGYSNANIKILENKSKKADIFTKNNFKIATKRGLYDNFSFETNFQKDIYVWYKLVFYQEERDISIIEKHLKQISSIDNYEKWLLYLSLFNYYIRKHDFDKTEFYLSKLKNLAAPLAYINSRSYLILLRDGKEKCRNYLDNNVDINNILNRNNNTMIESLVLKNYSQISDNLDYKKQIIKKSLINTPYDVDLWKSYFENEGKYDNYKIKDIISSGYLDKELLSKLKISTSDKKNLMKILLSFYSVENVKNKLIPLLSNSKYSKYIDIIYSDVDDYLGEKIYEIF